MNHSWTFAIDRGGTFTDVVARASDGLIYVEAEGYCDADGELLLQEAD